MTKHAILVYKPLKKIVFFFLRIAFKRYGFLKKNFKRKKTTLSFKRNEPGVQKRRFLDGAESPLSETVRRTILGLRFLINVIVNRLANSRQTECATRRAVIINHIAK